MRQNRPNPAPEMVVFLDHVYQAIENRIPDAAVEETPNGKRIDTADCPLFILICKGGSHA